MTEDDTLAARVRRFHMWCTGTHKHITIEQPDGEYVEYGDYHALQQRLAEVERWLQRGIAEIKKELKSWPKWKRTKRAHRKGGE